jgi:uncharacterized cupin superfamily protein
VKEARLEDGVPVTAGWFVLNARDAPWLYNELRGACKFGGEGEAHFDDLGIVLYWLTPGQAMALYHDEAGQEDFLVLAGRPRLVIEGAERSLEPWDLVHCPPRAAHTIVAADEPALVLGVGARVERGSARYPVEPAALRYGAGVPDAETTSTAVYRSFGEAVRGPAPALIRDPAGSRQSSPS